MNPKGSPLFIFRHYATFSKFFSKKIQNFFSKKISIFFCFQSGKVIFQSYRAWKAHFGCIESVFKAFHEYILGIFRKLCAFWALDIAPTLDVPVLFLLDLKSFSYDVFIEFDHSIRNPSVKSISVFKRPLNLVFCVFLLTCPTFQEYEVALHQCYERFFDFTEIHLNSDQFVTIETLLGTGVFSSTVADTPIVSNVSKTSSLYISILPKKLRVQTFNKQFSFSAQSVLRNAHIIDRNDFEKQYFGYKKQ